MIAGVLAGAFAALFWGASDFLAVKPVREIGPFRTLFYGLPFAVVAVFAYVYFFEGFKQMPSGAIMLVLAASFFNFLALFSFYSSFEKGLLSITSPISAGYALVVVVLSFFLLEERLSVLQSFAVFLAICGAVLVSAKFSEIRKLRLRVHEGVALALVSAFCWGVSVFLFKPVSSIATGQAILFLELGTLASLVLAGFFLKKKFSAPPANVFPNIAAAQSLNSFGSIALIVGYSTSPASIVAPISALYPVVALGLAFVFLKERLDLSQKFGVAVSICALFLAAI